MGTIMRGDQTLQLIQKYYNYYPEIARNTQDADGRRARSQMWMKITEELNERYETNFSVEQYKKKIQNVQCTSRQKLQSGKRNLGVAEFEYLRLFEHDKLNGNGAHSTNEITMTRSSSADLSSGMKMEQMLEQFGICLEQPVLPLGPSLGDSQLAAHHQFEGSASDSDSTSGEPSIPAAKSPPPPVGPPAGLMDPRQLMLVLSQLSQLNAANGEHPPLPKAEVEAPEREPPVAPPPLPCAPLLKRPFVAQRDDAELTPLKKKRVSNGGLEDGSWKHDLLKLQAQILDNQHKILVHLSRPPAPLPDFSAVERKLDALCETIGQLDATLKAGLVRSSSSLSSSAAPLGQQVDS